MNTTFKSKCFICEPFLVQFKVLLTITLLLSSSVRLYAQKTVTSSGDDAIGSGGSSSYTIGQIDYTTYSAGSGSSALESIVIGITLSNTTTTGITANVFLDNHTGSNDVHIVKNATIPAGSSLEVMSGNKLVLQNSGSAGDVLRISAGTATACDAIVSVLEDV